MGISKRELLCDYYPGELDAIVKRWNRLHGAEEAEEHVDAAAFFGESLMKEAEIVG